MADGSAESIQQRIQIARRDAEALKDRIKRKKDELADTTCKCIFIARPDSLRFTKSCAQDAPDLFIQCAMSRASVQSSFLGWR
jgi:hypothetical protein